jgi:hypothetical protein
MAEPQPQGCLDTIIHSIFGMIVTVVAIVMVMVVFVHG